jgi:hypothetical protein
MADGERQTGGEVLERTKHQVKKPEMFKVLLLNDDYTTMDFVIEILESVFYKQPSTRRGRASAACIRTKWPKRKWPRWWSGPGPAASRCWRRWNRSKRESDRGR